MKDINHIIEKLNGGNMIVGWTGSYRFYRAHHKGPVLFYTHECVGGINVYSNAMIHLGEIKRG